MHFHLLDTYGHLDGPIHRLPAPIKLLAALAIIMTAVATSVAHPIRLAALAMVVVVTAAVSRLPWSFLFKRLILLEPLVLGVAVLALFQPHGTTIFVFLLFRSTLCLFTMILLANTTPFHEILAVLKRLHIPALIVTTLALMHRYLTVMLEESLRMRRARKARTFTESRGIQWRNLATVASQLFLRCSQRADRIYAAMCSRGWR